MLHQENEPWYRAQDNEGAPGDPSKPDPGSSQSSPWPYVGLTVGGVVLAHTASHMLLEKKDTTWQIGVGLGSLFLIIAAVGYQHKTG